MLLRTRRFTFMIFTIGLLYFLRAVVRIFPFGQNEKDLPVTVILAAVSQENLTLLREDSGLREGDQQVVYLADDPNGAIRRTPMNKGREAMVYLSYLIDNYHSLPELMVFMHAGRKAWHNNILLHGNSSETVSRLHRSHAHSQGFVNLVCDWRLSCRRIHNATDGGIPAYQLTRMHLKEPYLTTPGNHSQQTALFRKLWTDILPHRQVADSLAISSGGQFALSRKTALQVPLNELHRLRNWIINTDLDEKAAGAVLEGLWHLIFDRHAAPVTCPQPRLCYCMMYGISFRDDAMLDEAMGWVEEVDKAVLATRHVRFYAGLAIDEVHDEYLRKITDGLWDSLRRNSEEVFRALEAKRSQAQRRVDMLIQEAVLRAG